MEHSVAETVRIRTTSPSGEADAEVRSVSPPEVDADGVLERSRVQAEVVAREVSGSGVLKVALALVAVRMVVQ